MYVDGDDGDDAAVRGESKFTSLISSLDVSDLFTCTLLPLHILVNSSLSVSTCENSKYYVRAGRTRSLRI